MKKPLLFLSALLITTLVIQLSGQERRKKEEAPSSEFSIKIDKVPTVPYVERIGINLGNWNSWGTEQFGQNILLNPGFEGQIDRILVIVSQADTNSFSDEAGWGYPNHTWNEAEFQIRTGPSAGKRGIVKKSINSGENGFPQYFAQKTLPPIEENDIIVLTKVRRPDPPDLWTINSTLTVSTNAERTRPNSSGNQSIQLTPTISKKAVLSYSLDTMSERIGKGIQINGRWRFSIWAKGEKPEGELFVLFQRKDGSTPFIKKTLDLTTQWQEYIIDFHGTDSESSGDLTLFITAFHPNNSVWIDDVYLSPQLNNNLPFRKEMVDALKKINPSYIREFPSTGDTWENRIAPPHERKTWLLRLAGGRNETVYSYSLPDFLSLCQEVGSNPWIILSPTLSNYETQEFGSFLSKYANTTIFSNVILEFGNENWNWLYRPTSVPYNKQHGILAEHLFKLITQSAGSNISLEKLVNGQYTAPWESLKLLEQTPNADGLAIAPYFMHSLDNATPDSEALKLLFSQDLTSLHEIGNEVLAQDKKLAIYEVNLHTTQSNAKGYERNRLVTSAAAGTALAKNLLHYMEMGANPIMVYNLAQYDTPTWEIEDFVNLWGVVRDFGPPLRMRPTGLAVQLLNQVIEGSLHRSVPIGSKNLAFEKLTLAAFKGNTSWKLAVTSENDQPITFTIEFPQNTLEMPTEQHLLSFHSPFDNNENQENVGIETLPLKNVNRSVTITVPAWGLVILK